MQKNSLLIINAGSSSIKFSIFAADGNSLLYKGNIDGILQAPIFTVFNDKMIEIYKKTSFAIGHDNALGELCRWLNINDNIRIKAIGHRIVHGGRDFSAPVIINNKIILKLKKLIPFAPLHQGHNILAMEVLKEIYPKIPQIACFDTSFHNTMPDINRLFAIPEVYSKDGLQRYGFHGLSYEYICSVLPRYFKPFAKSNVIIAHLGNGASMCAVKNGRSIATTMGFTPLDGLVMGTRCGSIDPGIILYLMREKGMSEQEISDLLYKESGLKALSGVSYDMRLLLKDKDKKAKFAVDYFCMQAARQLSGLIPTLGELHAIVFTAGIGESSAIIRDKICLNLRWLGVRINAKSNKDNLVKISNKDSKIPVYVIPTNEDLVIVRYVWIL